LALVDKSEGAYIAQRAEIGLIELAQLVLALVADGLVVALSESNDLGFLAAKQAVVFDFLRRFHLVKIN